MYAGFANMVWASIILNANPEKGRSGAPASHLENPVPIFGLPVTAAEPSKRSPGAACHDAFPPQEPRLATDHAPAHHPFERELPNALFLQPVEDAERYAKPQMVDLIPEAPG
jgi:hypothetical protein